VIGDLWLLGVEHQWDRGEGREAVEAAGINYQTAKQYGSVAAAYKWCDRSHRLKFTHHLAAMSAPAEERKRWLSRAEKKGWSVGQLRAEIAEAKRIAESTHKIDDESDDDEEEAPDPSKAPPENDQPELTPEPGGEPSNGNGGDPGETAKAMAAQHAAAEAAGNDCDPEASASARKAAAEEPQLSAFKSAVALLAALNRERSFKMCHGFKEYETEPAEIFVSAMSLPDLENASDFLIGIQDAIEDAERKAKKAKQIASEAKHPEKAHAKAREETIRAAMEDDLEEAKREAKESGERWADIKDDWVEEWKQDCWGDEQEAEFNEEFCKNWQSDHGTPFPGAAAVNPPSPAKQREAGARR
jgi:hypothetical protein